jgi:hypothetical protein
MRAGKAENVLSLRIKKQNFDSRVTMRKYFREKQQKFPPPPDF